MSDPLIYSGVSWTELNTIITASGVVLTLVGGYLWRSHAAIWKAIESNRERIENGRVEVARTYATTDTVKQVEERLTKSIDRMSDQIGVSLNQITLRLEQMFVNFHRSGVLPIDQK